MTNSITSVIVTFVVTYTILNAMAYSINRYRSRKTPALYPNRPGWWRGYARVICFRFWYNGKRYRELK